MNPFKVWDIVELKEWVVNAKHVLFKKKMKIIGIDWDRCLIDTWDQAYLTMKIYYELLVWANNDNNFYLNLMSE